MRPINLVIVLITLITSAHAGEQNVSLQVDTAPIENPPLPRPKPSLHDIAAENPAALISAFRHQNGEESVVISSALTRIAQAQADAIAVHDSLDHNALAPFPSRIGRSGLSRAAENIAYGHADFASTLKQWTNSPGHRANLLLHGAKGSALRMHKLATEPIGQWSSGRNKSPCGFICRAAVDAGGPVRREYGRVIGNRLWRLARDHSIWPRPARNRGRREDREIGVAAPQSIEADLTVSYGCKLTAQKTWRGTMFGRRPVGVDDTDTRARLKRGNEIVEQAIGLGDFVIHVHQNCNVERIGRQPWIVRLAKADYNVLQSEITHPTAQAPQIFGHNILCNDAAVRTDDWGQPYDVIAAARANVCDAHPGFDAEQTHELAWFVGIVTLLFVLPDWADNVRDWAIGFWKAAAGVPDPAKNSCAQTDIANVAAKTVVIIIRITAPT
jgi:hypothetical protein